MTSSGEVDLHSDSGDRRLNGGVGDEVKGHGICRTSGLRRGRTRAGKRVVHVVDARWQSHRL
eukprot:8984568-Pyramimonas_sp.AAC.1